MPNLNSMQPQVAEIIKYLWERKKDAYPTKERFA